MSTDKLQRLIDDTINYIDNVNRFYPRTLYIDGKSSENSTFPEEFVKDRPEHGKVYGVKDTRVEKDLFGNVVSRKEEWEFSQTLDEMNSHVCECLKCPLGHTRTKFVFGTGNPNSDVMLIGEAPGADEDIQGIPFVGRAGKLLDKMLEAIGFQREEVYICNILKCRPPGNRNPMPDEIEKCLPYLQYQIKLVKPKIIVLLGRVAAETLLKSKQPLNKLRGKVHYYNGIQTLVMFHPAALLRNPQWKRPAWEDLQELKKIYDGLSAQN